MAVVNRLPSAGFAQSSICENTEVLFTDTSLEGNHGITSWIWDFDEPGQNSVLQNPTIVFQQNGLHFIELIVIDDFGCTDTAIQSTNIRPSPTAAFTASSQDTCADVAVCFTDQSIYAAGATAAGWEWDMESVGISDHTTQNPCHVYSAAGMYDPQLIVIDNFGCKDTNQLSVNIAALPNVDFTWDPACEGTPMSFSDQSTSANSIISQWSWDFGNGVTSNEQNPVNTYADSGQFTVQLFATNAAGCISSYTSSVTVDWKPSISVFPLDTIVCPGASVRLVASGATSFQWSPGRWLDQRLSNSVLSTPESQIDYTVTGFNGACPPSDTSVSIQVLQDVALELNANPEKLISGAISQLELRTTAAVDNISWSPIESLSCTDCDDPVASPLETTTYFASVTWGTNNSLFCEKSDSITITVINECYDDLLYLPNAFTPNADGLNDRFYVRGIGIQHVTSFIIYDRWGNLVFEQTNFDANDKQFGWDGQNMNAQQLNSATFVYAVEAICQNGEKISKSGAVNLLR